MAPVRSDRVLCFDCVQLVDPVEMDGVKHLQCWVCGHAAPLEKALDDCFLFVVASAIADSLKKDYARSYRFMPLSVDRGRAFADRSFMVRTGRALVAA